jgi:hypothetical protein
MAMVTSPMETQTVGVGACLIVSKWGSFFVPFGLTVRTKPQLCEREKN